MKYQEYDREYKIRRGVVQPKANGGDVHVITLPRDIINDLKLQDDLDDIHVKYAISGGKIVLELIRG